MSSKHFNGYTLDEIRSAAASLLQTAEDAEYPQDLTVLALCMAIVKRGTPEDLDTACMMLDIFGEVVGTEVAPYPLDDER